MKLNFTFRRMYEFEYILIFLLPIFFPNLSSSQSVRVYTETISSQSNTDNALNAVDEDLVTHARVRASSGLALGIGAYSGHVELQYAALLPANTTSYIKIETDDNLLPALLGGSLGGLLADVAGTILLGNQEFTVQAKNNSTVVLQGDSQDIGEFATNRLRITIDESGDYFIAITPDQAYDRIRLSNRLGSLIGFFNVRNLDVYDAFYISQADNCGSASYTSFSGEGITLDLINLSDAGVDNPQNVLDANTANFSQLSLGIVGVAASVEQTVYFDGLSNANDQFNVRLRLDPSLVEVGAANSIQLIASNGPGIVQTTTLGSLLNAELVNLLQANQVVTLELQTATPANRITVRYNALLNIQLDQSLDLYDVIRVPRAPVITDAFTLDPVICAGNTASLIAGTATGYELHWYTTAQGGAPLAVTQSGDAFTTPALSSDASFYVSAVRTGCAEESRRIRIDVDVVALPTAADIAITSPLTACQGNITLIPSSAIGGAGIHYYTSQDMTVEITTGYAGNPGVTYIKDDATGMLAISGLTEVDSPYAYYIALEANGLCTNASGMLKEVIVNYSGQLDLQAGAALEGCGSVNLADAILNFDASNTYLFFDDNGNPITAEAASNITTNGNYSIQAQNSSGACASTVEQVAVTIAQQPGLALASTALVTTIGNSVTLNATSNGAISWYGPDGNALPSNTAGPFTQAGIYAYTAVAVSGSCSDTASMTVTVLDPAQCPPLTEPDYATMQNWSSIITGGVFNASNAVDSNLQTHATITTGIGLLGIGTTWQTLQWEETVGAGTPVTIKLGSEYSGLALIGSFSVVGTKRDGSGVPQTIGSLQPVSGSLANLLPGQNAFEFTFTPSNGSGPQDYDGVRIMIASAVSLAQNAKVFEAYYMAAATQVACGDDARDVLYGAVDLGVGVLTATVGVDDAFDAIDGSQLSYATMYSGLGVLAAAEMTVVFNTPSIEGDRVRLRLSKPGTLLNAGVLNGISIQPMLGNAVSGTVVSPSLLSVELLGAGDTALVTFEPDATFDRVRICFGGVAGVLEFLNVHDVERLADTQVEGADETNAITACQGQTIVLEADAVPCTTFIWYDAEAGGNVVATGNSFTLPANLAAGEHTFWIQPIRFGCSFLSRGRATVNVTETAPEGAITSITINGQAESSICAPNGDVILLATLDTSVTITNPVFYWYSSNGTTMTLITGQTGQSLPLAGLTAGSYSYFVGLGSDEHCQTAAADLAEISFTILPSSTAADIAVPNSGICLPGPVVLLPSSSLANSQFTWYFTNDTSAQITDGLIVGGVTYNVSANGALTITGLDETASPYVYYVAVVSDATCINQAGQLAAATVTVGTLPSPTANETTQNFCAANNPTVANLQVNEANVIFYDAPAAGNPLDPSTPLVAGAVYHAALTDGTCESEIRLAITVTIGNPDTPTTNNNPQVFCAAGNPTVADLQVNETGVVFYDAPAAGTALAASAALTAGIYYAAIADGLCESETRLAITVTISDPAPPTTNNASQEFCAGSGPTVADLDINEPNVNVYDTAAGTLPLAAGTLLVTGTYYATLVEAGTGCESSVRLEIAVNVSTVGTPTSNDATQDFCLANAPTVSNIQVNETAVTFYDAAVGGSAYSQTTPLTSGTYYASISNGVCESDIRLEIAVTVNDPGTPTANNAAQTFCEGDNPTVADIQVNETGAAFYTSATGGTALDPSTALATGTYYASLFDGTCESAVRLQVTVTISNPATPTTNDATQQFCLTDNPTVADIDVNEASVVFYTEAAGGTPLPESAALQTGMYYAAVVEGDCESAIRLEISVMVSGSDTAQITGGGQQSCISEEITYSTTAGMQNYTWTIVGGTITAGGTPADNTATVQWAAAGAGSVAVVYNDVNCGNTASAVLAVNVVVCSDLTIAKVVDNFTPNIGDEVTFTITVNNEGISAFTNVIINEQLPTGYTFVSSNATLGAYDPLAGLWIIPSMPGNVSAELEITALVNSGGNYVNTVSIDDSVPDDSTVLNNGAEAWVEPVCLIVYNEFTPNGDGNNDLFQIDCIENYPNSTLQVHNRYGLTVYKIRGYQNNWDGTANQNSPVNQDNKLPAGTYYYVLELGDGSGVNKAGWLYIMR